MPMGAGGSADFHLGRLVVDFAGGREHCGHGRRVYVQSAENPSRWDAGQFAAVDYYDGIIGSWAGILDEIVTEASMIISIFRYGWENLDSVSGQD